MILKPFSYYNDFLKLACEHKRWPLNKIRLIGSRFSGKTWNTADFICALLNLIDSKQEMVRASAIVLRHDKPDMEEMFDQYNTNLENVLLEQNVKILNSSHEWNFENGNQVRFKHINFKNKQKTIGAGWASIESEYIVIVYEEAYEFKEKEVMRIREAVRGSGNPNILEIFICNPWDPRNAFIKETLNAFPYNINEIDQMGEQKAVIYMENKKLGTKTPTLIHYANWRAIQPHKTIKLDSGINRYIALEPILIPQVKLDQLTENYAYDFESALTADYGCPGVSGTEEIYMRAMKNICEPQYYAHEYVVGGGDIGNGRSQKSGKTAFIFGAYDTTGYWDIYGEYVNDNKVTPKPLRVIYNEVVDFYLNMIEKYTRMTGHRFNYAEPLWIRVDLSNVTDISMLNEICEERNIDFMEFTPCLKLPIWDRIQTELYKMEQGLFRIDADNCDNLLNELSGARWDDKGGKEPQRLGEDHSINAFEYAIEEFMYQSFGDDLDRYQNKLSKKAAKYI